MTGIGPADAAPRPSAAPHSPQSAGVAAGDGTDGPEPSQGTTAPGSVPVRNVDAGHRRDMLVDAARVVIGRHRVGVSVIQRYVRVGFATAGRLLILLEDAGVIGPVASDGKRDVLVPASHKAVVVALLEQEYAEAGGQA